MENVHYYILILFSIIVACYIVKRVTSCIIKIMVFVALLFILAVAYFLF